MIQVRKKDKENAESLIRRFSRRIQQSGVLMQARKTRFQSDKKSKRKQRDEALYKVKIRKEINKLKKIDRFDNEALKNIKKRMNK
jgi:ribosomal protein S21